MIRFLDPRERQKHNLIRKHNRLLDERRGERKKFDKQQELDSVEDQLDALDSSPATVPCFKCEGPVDLSLQTGQPAYSLTVCSLVEHKKGDDPRWQFFSSPTSLKLEEGKARLVALLEPPGSGEIALCATCKAFFEQYMQVQEVALEPGL